MQLSTVLLSALLAIGAQAVPQNSDVTTSTATVSQVATTASVALTPQQTCLQKCSPGDVSCQAACVNVPHPSENQMHDVTSCVAKCDQGDGSPGATAKYADCTQKCISSIILASGTPAAGAAGSTAASNAASATGSAASSGASKTGSASGSSASSSAQASGNAAANDLQKGAAVAGLAGVVMAMFAL